MALITTSESLDFATQIEEDGEDFYLGLFQKLTDLRKGVS